MTSMIWRMGAPQVPLLPVVTSCDVVALKCLYRFAAGLKADQDQSGVKRPFSAKTLAMSGVARLVPPIWNHPDWKHPQPQSMTGVESYMAAPVYGSASAETSATARWVPQ